MSGIDTIQAVPAAGGALKDGKASGYLSPSHKKTKVAVFDKGGAASGKAWATFTRKFDSPEGVTLREDGFVYLVAAYKRMSNSLDAKHTRARAMRLKISLFGGQGDSYRMGDGKKGEPEPEGEPEGEGEKKKGEPEPEGEPEGEGEKK